MKGGVEVKAKVFVEPRADFEDLGVCVHVLDVELIWPFSYTGTMPWSVGSLVT